MKVSAPSLALAAIVVILVSGVLVGVVGMKLRGAAALSAGDNPGSAPRGDTPRVQAEMLFTAFITEPRDIGWASSAESRLLAHLQQISGSYVDTVECKTSICRIQTTHASDDDYRKFYSSTFALTDKNAWNAASFGCALFNVREGTEPVKVFTTFVAREGFDLPLRSRSTTSHTDSSQPN